MTRLNKTDLTFLVCTLMCAVLLSFKSYAVTKVTIGIIPGAIDVNSKLSNDYMNFIRQLEDSTLDFVPMARADQMFERKLVNCIFPASTAQMPNKERFIQSKPLKTIYAYIFVKNKALLNQSLADKNIALKRGLGFGNIRNRIFANYVELNTDELVLKMLKRERVDAIVAYLPDLIAAQHKIGERHLPYYNKEQPIYEADEAMVCYKNAQNEKYIANANKIIDALKMHEK